MKAKIVSADEIKKSFKGYNPRKASRYHQESARLADKKLDSLLRSESYRTVILMNGGTASGKTSIMIPSSIRTAE